MALATEGKPPSLAVSPSKGQVPTHRLSFPGHINRHKLSPFSLISDDPWLPCLLLGCDGSLALATLFFLGFGQACAGGPRRSLG